MFSQTVEYALRAVTQLATRPGQIQSTQELAEVTKVPAAYLSKVLQSLHRKKIVQVKRGINGGYTLSKSPKELSLYEVVQAVEPIQRIRTCPLELASHGKRLCSLHKKMDLAMAQTESAFRSTTLHDLVNAPGASKPLCD
jgi:Rrf2 family protein